MSNSNLSESLHTDTSSNSYIPTSSLSKEYLESRNTYINKCEKLYQSIHGNKWKVTKINNPIINYSLVLCNGEKCVLENFEIKNGLPNLKLNDNLEEF